LVQNSSSAQRRRFDAWACERAPDISIGDGAGNREEPFAGRVRDHEVADREIDQPALGSERVLRPREKLLREGVDGELLLLAQGANSRSDRC